MSLSSIADALCNTTARHLELATDADLERLYDACSKVLKLAEEEIGRRALRDRIDTAP